MRKAVWKFPLKAVEWQAVEMPARAEILTVQNQNETACLWALVDPTAEKEMRQIEVFGTGHNIQCDMGLSRKYISTFQIEGGLVFHAFERTN